MCDDPYAPLFGHWVDRARTYVPNASHAIAVAERITWEGAIRPCTAAAKSGVFSAARAHATIARMGRPLDDPSCTLTNVAP